MSGLELALAISGVGVTALVGMGMVLITPRGRVAVHTEGSDPKGSSLSPESAPESRGAAASR